jgi:hypothetical protein
MVVDAEVAHRVGREKPRRDEQGQQERGTECDFHSTGTTQENRDLDGNLQTIRSTRWTRS